MKRLKKTDYRLVIWIPLFFICALNNGFVEIYTDNSIVNVINWVLLFVMLVQTTYLLGVLIGKKIKFTVIEVIPSNKEGHGFPPGRLLNLKRKYFYVVNEQRKKRVLSSFFASKDRISGPDEIIRGYRDFRFRVRMIDRRTILMKIGIVLLCVIALFLVQGIYHWLERSGKLN